MATQYTAGLSAGQVLSAATMNSIGAAWESYTPALTAVTTNPTLGTGSTASGEYCQINKLIVAAVAITFGTSGTNAGSGAYRVSLPISASNTGPQIMGSGFVYDSSTNGFYLVAATRVNATTCDMLYSTTTQTLGSVGSAGPWAWAASDQIRLLLTYEAA